MVAALSEARLWALVAAAVLLSDGAQAQERAVKVEGTVAGRFDQGKKWAVVIGVNEYLDPAIPRLQYCVADARAVAHTLTSRCGYEADRLLLITDDQERLHLRPLKINLQKQIALWLRNAAKADTVMVFFSGHGFLDERGQGFLAPQDCEKASLGLTGFRTDELRDLLHQCAASQKLLVLDCCHAGGQKSGETIGSSGQEIGLSFQSAEGLITLASCRKKERSQEWKLKGHGLFTHFLIQGIEGDADFDRNGLIDSDEIYRYAVDNVPTTAQRELNAQQTPVRIIGEDVVGLFVLARCRPAAATAEPAPPPERALPATVVNSLGMSLVLVPAGEFEMGSTDEEVQRIAGLVRDFGEKEDAVRMVRSERPRHAVRIRRPFYLGSGEVTVGQYRQFVEAVHYRTEAQSDGQGGIGPESKGGAFAAKPSFTWLTPGFPQDDNHPVVQVSWNDAIQFCRWLSGKEGRTYRLPTEAEWEYACRAGTTTRFWSGDDPDGLGRVENLADATLEARFFGTRNATVDDGQAFTASTGRMAANRFGLYDMLGNVSEWCQDWYAEDAYRGVSIEDPQGPATGSLRVLRGGSWYSPPALARVAERRACKPQERSCTTGFRVAWTP